MVEVETCRASLLGSHERSAWSAFQGANPSLASPYFSLGFLDAVAQARRDTHIAVIREKGAITGFLPFHQGLLGYARPLGGPLGDHHGFIAPSDAQFDLRAVLRQAGLKVFDFSGALGTQAAFRPHAHFTDGSWVIDLSAGYEAWLAGRGAVEPKAFRNLRARRRKLEDETTSFVFRVHDDRPEVLAKALEWKSAQYVRTGHFDVFSVDWTRRLINALGVEGLENAQRLVSSLEIDGKLAAAHVGVRSGTVLHYWFPVYDPEFARVGPGLNLLLEIARELPAQGLKEIHLGPGEYDFKRELASWQFPLMSGYVAAPSLAGAARQLADNIQDAAERLPLGPISTLPGRAFRRIDRFTAFRAA
ncbi:cellulose biosynthesis protein CelD [Glycocaulis alkaliphilus]|uniref:Cellulose biosynthesis protein CelD n=1 Tax=Glycocaulis alkaliphilus TaxID=1434191 RepID=A0A3T0EAT2_9PROT|nr:GNAT family N-acetyltransferase [Glycocaulis alkaliphilus]AZU04402.1 cellulose biosynthesis protein CelD [Glycocaulis alkaliphilus]GGB78102.1 polysaccharide biosynthesis protein CelD [Glycocaulis alkaliphilus]